LTVLFVFDLSLCQVMGAAASYAAWYGEAAVLKAAAVTKLTRNLCLAAALPYFSVAPSSFKSLIATVPRFVLLFVAAAGVRTAGDWLLADVELWHTTARAVGDLAPRVLLCVAMAAVGLQIRPSALLRAGWRPFAVGAAGAAVVAVAGLSAALLVGSVAQKT
jgi:uncharacterized membrane protein YadS